MADGGLPSLNQVAPAGAGLGDSPVSTMRDKQQTYDYLSQLGAIDPSTPAPGATMADDDTSVGLGGEIMYGARRAGESAFQGAGDFLGDRLGVGQETLYSIGDVLGPSDEQEEAQARQAAAEDRSFAGETADLIAQEAVPTAAPVALALGGAAIAGPVGAAIGGGAGLIFNWARMRDETRDRAKREKAEALHGAENLTPEKVDAVELDENDLTKVEYTAALGAGLDYVTPLKVLRRLKPGRAAELGKELVQRSAAKAAGRKLTGDALTEGTTEVAQMALQEIVFDEELRSRMSEDEVAETAKWVAQEYGKEAAQSFIAGSAIGGAMGAGSGAYQQKMANAKRANDVQALAQAGEISGVDIADFESAAKDPERVGQMVQDADGIRAAEARLRGAEAELDAYAAQPEESRDPEVMEALTSVRDRAKKTYNQTHDEIMPRYGGMKISEMDARRAQIEGDIKRQAVERAQDNGYVIDDDMDPATVNSVLEPVEEAKAELSSAQRKMDNTSDDRFRSKYSKQAKKARQKLRAAEINARKALYGESPKEAEHQLDREAGIRRQRERLFGSEQDPKAVIDRADQVIAERSESGKVKETRTAARERMVKLRDDLDGAETETQIQEIETKIAKEQAKLTQPDPLVEAAMRAKRDAQRTLGIEPTADEAVDPMAGLPEAEGALEAEGDVQPAEEVGGEATAEPPTTSDQDARRAVEGDMQLAAGAEPGVTQAGVALPEAPERYFDEDPNAVEVPVSDLRPLRARPEGIENAGTAMRAAFDGEGGRRKPVSVRLEDDGSYTVLDGNSTVANAAQAGWSNIPVRVVTDEQFASESAPKFAKKTGTRTSVEGRTITARGRESRRPLVERQAEKEGLDVRFEPTDAEAVPENDPRRRGLSAGRQYPWTDAIDMVGGDATVADVEAHLEEMEADVEYQAAFDADGNLLGFGTNNHPNGVALPRLAQTGSDITTVHNHPLDTPFSPADVAMMHSGRVVRSRIVTPSGRFEMRAGAPLADMDYQQALDLTRGVLDEVQAANPGIEGGRESAARIYQEATLRILDADGVIEYTQPFTNLTPEEEGLINDITDTVFDTRDGGPSQLGDGFRDDAGGGAAPLGQEQPAGGERPADAQGQPPQGRREGESVGETKARWKEAQVAAFPTLDDVMSAARRNNPKLHSLGYQIADRMADIGITYIPGPIKKVDSINRKIGPGGSKAGAPPGSLGDVIRGTFTAPDDATVDQVIDAVRSNGQDIEMLAEDWSVTPAGYADRSLVLRMPDGQLAEIQIMPPAMLAAKMSIKPDGGQVRLPFAAGHSLYEIARSPSSTEFDKARANREMRQLYASAAMASSSDVQNHIRNLDPGLLTEASQDTMDALQRAMYTPTIQEGMTDDTAIAATTDTVDTGADGGPSAGRARGGSRRLADGSLAPLEGAPRIRGHKGPIQELVKVAEDYAARNGIDLVPQAEFVSVDPDRARRIADAYEAMPHAPQDPAVQAAYADLIDQTRAQYDALSDAGYEFFFFAPDNPYGDSPATAMEDIRLNKRMGVFPTDAGFGTSESFDPSDNPMLADTGIQWPDEQGNMKPVYANDLFRAVHDAFGHGLEGAGFRADGEENAWQAHIRLFTGPAKGAITTETRGQNSWLNYGPHGETNQTAAVEETVFADQKTGLMPEWTWTEGVAPPAPEANGEVAQGVDEPVPGTPVPLYVARDVVDDGGLRQWAIDNGITDPLPFDDMHMTVTYSRDPVDIADAPAKTNSRTVSVVGEPMLLGSDNDTLVVPLSKGGPTMDHKRYRKAGASHDYSNEYTPHITVKYDATEADLETLRAAPKFTGKIKLGPEVQKRLRPGGTPAPAPGDAFVPEVAMGVDTPEFKRWFGDSKVVNPDGSPMVVYHGTPAEFSAFDEKMVGTRDGGFFGNGFYATPDMSLADEFSTDADGEPGDVMELYASIENPFVFDLNEDTFGDAIAKIEKLLGRELRHKSNFFTFNLTGDEPRRFTAAAKAAGHDGVMVNRDGELQEVVAFRPTQLKSTQNQGTYDPESPEIAQAVDMPAYIDIGYKDSQSAFRSTLKGLKNPGQVTRTWSSWLEDNFFNGFAPIRRLENDVTGGIATGAESAFKAAEMAVNDTGRNEALMYYGAAKLGAHGEFGIKDGTKGLRQIFDDVAASGAGKKGGPQALADWMGYMAAKRAQDLKARNITTPLSDSDIRDALAKETPAFKQAAKDWKDHNDANIDFLVDTGRISKAQAKAMKDDEHYVPFYRSTQQMADGSSPDFSLDDYLGIQAPGRAGSGAVLRRDPGIKKIVGGDRVAIDNLMLNMIRNSQAMVAAGMRNQAANKTFDLMEMAGLAKPVKAQKVSKKTGKIVRREKPANSVRMWINGREKFVIVNEEGAPLIAALGGLHPQQRGAIENLMINIASIFRQGITLSPAFMLRNAIRGAVSTGLLTSGSNLTASNNFFTGFTEVLRASDATKSFKHMSGMGDYRFGNPDIGFGVDDILIDYGLAPKTIMSRMRGVLDKAEKIGTATELADRVAAFKTMQKSGVRSDEAAYQALTIMNYSRRGNNAAVRMLMPMVPFLNARLQGLSRLTEGSIKKGGALPRKRAMLQLAMNGTLLSVASLALWGMTNADEEDREKYLEEPMYRKLNYHVMYAGDKTIYIPKAFELGAIFSTIPELAMDAVVNDQGDQVVPGLQQITAQTFLFNAIPAAMLPAIEVMTNYSFFKQGPVEGMRESMLRPRDRTTGASPLAVFVGQKLGLSDAADVSPVQIEHYLQGYGGAYYHMLSAATEIAGSELGLIPQTPQGALGDVPIGSLTAERALGSMVKATPQQTSKYLGEFYDTKDYIDQIYMSAKTAATNGDVEYARHLLAQVSGLPGARKLMNKIGPKMSDLNAAIRLTRQDRTLTRKQKADRLAPLVKARNQLSKQVVGVVRQIEEGQGATFASVA